FGELGSAHSPWAFESHDTKWRSQALRDVLAVIPELSEQAASQAGGVAARIGRLLPFRDSAAVVAPAHAPYVEAVLSAVADNRPLPVGPDEARASLELCTAIYASAL